MRCPFLLLLAVLLIVGPASAQIDEAGGPPAQAGGAVGASGGRRILLIGDSHTTMPFGKALDGALRTRKNDAVATYGVCSAGPNSYLTEKGHACGWYFRAEDGKEPARWVGSRVSTEQRKIRGSMQDVKVIKTPALKQLLIDHKPTVTIIALGSNPTSASGVTGLLDLLVKANSGCLWIGPPSMREPSESDVDKVYALLARALKDRCALIDSRKFTYLRYPATGGDGTHYDGKVLGPLGTQWGQDAGQAVEAALRTSPD